jgi:chromosome segregation ATPase
VRFCAGVILCLLAWTLRGQDLPSIEPSLQKIERGLSLIDSSTTGISDYFESERLRLLSDKTFLESERESLKTESERLQSERDSLLKRGLALASRETALEKRGQSLDEREKRLERVGWMLKTAPYVAVGLIVVGVVIGRATK